MESISAQVEERLSRGALPVWTTPARKRRSSIGKFFHSLGQFVKVYCDNTSLAGYKYLSKSRRPWAERIFWIIIHATTACTLAFTINSLYVEYLRTPVVTAVDSDNYPSDKLNFPAVAVCNVNRISRKYAEEFALQLFHAKASNKTLFQIMEIMRDLGSVYETAFDRNALRDQGDLKIDQLLHDFYHGDFDITHLMKRLTPTCSDQLLACHFRNQRRNCSDIFSFRKTQNGYCCTFNYAREADDIKSDREVRQNKKMTPYLIGSPGVSSGLTFVLEPHLKDYYFPFLPITGWKVTIFNTGDYPDNTSGGVSEVLVSPSTEAFLQLAVKSFYSTDAVRSVPVDKRKCMFSDELNTLQAYYTYSDCLVDCRADAIWDACNCRPFVLPRRGNEEYSRKVCDTSDSKCLHSHKIGWWSVLPHDTDDDEEAYSYESAMDEGGNESLRCHSCYPACNDVSYYLETTAANLRPGGYQSELLRGIEMKDQSIVHVYFTTYTSTRLKMDLGYYWFELLSNIGGICGVFIGFSLISIIELVYFLLRFAYDFLCELRNRTTPPRGSSKSVSIKETWEPSRVGELYWDELRRPSQNYITRIRRQRRWPRY